MSAKKGSFAFGMAIVAGVLLASTAHAGNHSWKFTEFFSNADGSIQFIELQESLGASGERFLYGNWVMSDNTGKLFEFPEDLIEPTTDKYILLGTVGFAALPHAPTPDYIIEDSFIAIRGDTVRYVWDDVTYEVGALPLDGVRSIDRNSVAGVNTPTNYAGETGSVVAPNIPAASTWGLITTALALLIAGSVTIARRSSKMTRLGVAIA